MDINYSTRAMLLASVALGLGSCASIQSQPISSSMSGTVHVAKSGDSLGTYFLPMRQIVLRVKATRNKKGQEVGYRFDEFDVSKDYLTLRDPNHGYMISQSSSALSDDKMRVAFDENNFISKIYWQGEDRSIDVIKDIANSVMRLSFGAVPPKKEQNQETEKAPEDKTKAEPFSEAVTTTEIVDPTSADSVSAVNARLQRYGLHIEALGGDGNALATKTNKDNGISSQGLLSGILYRPALSYQIKLHCNRVPISGLLEYSVCGNSSTSVPPKSWPISSVYMVQAENASPILSLELPRSPFVNRRTQYEFSAICGTAQTLPSAFEGEKAAPETPTTTPGHSMVPDGDCEKFGGGSLLTVNSSKPSEAKSFFDMTLNLVDTLVQFPIEKIRFLALGETEEKKLIDLQTQVLKAQKEKLEAERALLEARKSSAPEPKPEGAAPSDSNAY